MLRSNEMTKHDKIRDENERRTHPQSTSAILIPRRFLLLSLSNSDRKNANLRVTASVSRRVLALLFDSVGVTG